MNNRRQFLKSVFGGAAVVSCTRHVPELLFNVTRPRGNDTEERILVIVQLGGGNDGLNTIVPYGDDAYYQNRFTLAIKAEQVLKIDQHVGFHPSLTGFAQLLQQQRLSIVQGVGYPQPNRSHFESMDLWHTAHRINDSRQLGWLGRCLDDSHFADDLPAIHYGEGKQPLALGTRQTPVPSISSLDQFRLNVPNRKQFLERLNWDLSTPRGQDQQLLGYIHESAGVALKTAQRLENLLANTKQTQPYPATRLGRKLAAVSQLIDIGLPTRVYYLTHDGFDTHANQAAAHASLLKELGDALQVFSDDLDQRGHGQRTAVFSFSEFGRRVRENASRGTDHGAAAPVFITGAGVNAGLINAHPSLTDLDQGDLKYSIDYRQVYATLLEQWLNVESQAILGDDYPKLALFG